MKDDKEKLKIRLEKEGLLSGFLDGELDEVQVQRLCSGTESSERIKAEAQRCALRKSLRAFIRLERATGDANWSCWQAIEGQLEPYRKPRRWLIGSWLQGSQELLEDLLRPQVAGTVFACSLAVMALSVWDFQRSGIEQGSDAGLQLDTQQVASKQNQRNGAQGASARQPKSSGLSPTLVASAPKASSSSDLARATSGAATSFVATATALDPSSNAFLRNFSFEQKNAFSANMDASQGEPRGGGEAWGSPRVSIAQSLNPRGLRVGAADIEWLEAQSHVEILPSVNQNRPPVIWVGERIQ